MSASDNARKMFPEMPDEVFRLWLEPAIESYGWPFNTLDDSISETGWHLVMGNRLSLRSLAAMKWRRDREPFSKVTKNPSTKSTITIMLGSFIGDDGGIKDGVYHDSLDRLMFHIDTIKNTGAICAPVVAVVNKDGFDVLDGYHRLCAISVFNNDDFEVDIWVSESEFIG